MNESTVRHRRARALAASGSALMRTLAMLACIAAASVAIAQTQPQPQGAGGDPPSRAARLSDVSGQVWIYNAEGNEWIGVDRNQPLTTGDRIATDNGGAPRSRSARRRCASTPRPSSRSCASTTAATSSSWRAAASPRACAIRSRWPSSSSTPTKAAFASRPSAATASIAPNRRATSRCSPARRSSRARNTALPVSTGQHAQFWLDAGGVPQYAMVAPVRDAFAAWNDERDRAEDASRRRRRRASSRPR